MEWGLKHISSYELTEWMVYDRRDPIGGDRRDMLFATLMSVVANVHRNPKKRRKPYTPADFMPRWGPAPEPEEQTPEEMLAVVEMLALAFKAKDLRTEH